MLGRYTSISLRFMMQGLLNLLSYVVGGFVVGAISPRVRLLEPAVGAALCVAVMLLVTIFTPYRFMAFSVNRLLIGA